VSLYKRNSVWWFSIFSNGERVCESTGTSNRRKAEQIERQRREELNNRRHRVPSIDLDVTVGTVAARFIAEGLATPYYLDRLTHVLPFFGDIPVRDINQSLLRKYRQERCAVKSALKPATVNRDLAVLRRLVNFGVEEGIIPVNPLGRLRMERERRTKRPVMSVREELILMAHAPLHLQRIIRCGLDTGMRRGEIFGQRWEDVDLDNRMFHVSRSKTPEGESRIVPLTSRLYDMLLSFRKSSGIVFTYDGNPIKIVKTSWAASLRRSGLRHFRFHDLRHTANTRFMLAGVLQEVRREIVGHSSQHSRDVNDRYTQIGLAELKDAVRKLETWLDNQELVLRAENVPPLLLPSPQPSPAPTSATTEDPHHDGTEPQHPTV
jgi:integrase